MFETQAHLGSNRKQWETILGIVGVAIIFFTYIAKERHRDHAKDLIDSINESKSRFNASMDTQPVPYILEVINRKVDEMDRYLRWKKGLKQAEPGETMAARVFTVGLVERNYQKAFNSLIDLSNKLPDSPRALESEVNTLSAQLDSAAAAAAKFKETAQEDTAEIEETRIHGLFSAFHKTFEVTALKVLDEADKETKGLQNSFLFYTDITNGLYCVGFVLAIYGKWRGYRAETA